MTKNTEREVLRNLLLLDAERVIDAVIDGLSAAGGEPEWDGGTIEGVLQPFKSVIERVGMPWVGSTSDDAEAVNRWRRMTPREWGEVCPECWEEGHDCNAEEEGRECAQCGDNTHTLSSRDWCDGCEEEGAV